MKRVLGIMAVLVLVLSSAGIKAEAAGLKKTVTVFEFDNDSGYSSWGGMGHDLSAQLTDALMQSGNFIVLERQDLNVVMAEQDLAASDRMAQTTSTAKTGKIVPAQVLIKGKVTEFQENTSGGGQGLSIHGISLGTKKASVHMAVIIQLIDSTSGQIIDSQRVEGEAKSGGLSVGFSGAFDVSSSSFKATPTGKAVQMAIDRAVEYIVKKSGDIPWHGRVVMVKDGVVYLNAGENSGISSGDTFNIYREGEALVDPDSGLELGKENTKLGSIKVSEVQEKFSKASAEGVDPSQIAKGDLITKD